MRKPVQILMLAVALLLSGVAGVVTAPAASAASFCSPITTAPNATFRACLGYDGTNVNATGDILTGPAEAFFVVQLFQCSSPNLSQCGFAPVDDRDGFMPGLLHWFISTPIRVAARGHYYVAVVTVNGRGANSPFVAVPCPC